MSKCAQDFWNILYFRTLSWAQTVFISFVGKYQPRLQLERWKLFASHLFLTAGLYQLFRADGVGTVVGD